jgi:7-cyano-7-deazaguanine synthase
MSGVLLLSGGVDSAVLLAECVATGECPLCLSIEYGQRHQREVRAAVELARHYGCGHEIMSLDPVLFRGSFLTGGGNPDGDSSGANTVVPGRNLAFLGLAVALAASRHLDSVLFAAHAGDAEVYLDCRSNFLTAVRFAAQCAYRINVRAPFLHLSKRQIVERGRELGVPFDLTWSCYSGGETPCGACGACVGRREAGLA